MIGLLPTILANTAEEPQGIAALGIDPWAILAQAITFLVLFFLIKRFALDKIVKTLEERRKTIDKGVTLGLEMEKEKDQLDEQVNKLLQKARAEADGIIAESQKEAGAIVQQAEDVASKKADDILADAQHRIEDDIERAKKDLKQEMVELVSQATGIIIREKVDAKKDAGLIERALEEVR